MGDAGAGITPRRQLDPLHKRLYAEEGYRTAIQVVIGLGNISFGIVDISGDSPLSNTAEIVAQGLVSERVASLTTDSGLGQVLST